MMLRLWRKGRTPEGAAPIPVLLLGHVEPVEALDHLARGVADVARAGELPARHVAVGARLRRLVLARVLVVLDRDVLLEDLLVQGDVERLVLRLGVEVVALTAVERAARVGELELDRGAVERA